MAEDAAGAGQHDRPAYRQEPGLTRWSICCYLVAPDSLSAQQGRQDPLLPPAEAPGAALPGASGHLHRRPRRLAACADAVKKLCGGSLFRQAGQPQPRACGSLGALLRNRRSSSTTTAAAAWPTGSRACMPSCRCRGCWCSRRRWRSSPKPERYARRVIDFCRCRFGQVAPVCGAEVLADELASIAQRRRGSCCATSARSRATSMRRCSSRSRKPRCFRGWRPKAHASIGWFSNGVDTDVFFAARTTSIRLTRTAARCWRSPARWTTGPTSTRCNGSPPRCCPRLRERHPDARFYIVGARPSPRGAGAGPAARRHGDRHRAGRASLPGACRGWPWRRCASRAASRTRCSRRWPWASRSSSRRRRSKASLPSRAGT